MRFLTKTLTGVGVALAVATTTLAGGSSAFAAARDGNCDGGEFCYYYNSNEAGSVSDLPQSLGNYGASQPTCYVFKSPGNGRDTCIKNSAASVWNRTDKTVRVYFNSNFAGAHQDVAPGQKTNLNATLKNNNASHQALRQPPVERRPA